MEVRLMQPTRHIQQRMSQRGVTQGMVSLVMEYGTQEQGRYILGRKEALALLAAKREEERILMKILDKGGVVVVAADGTLITTYDYSGRQG